MRMLPDVVYTVTLGFTWAHRLWSCTLGFILWAGLSGVSIGRIMHIPVGGFKWTILTQWSPHCSAGFCCICLFSCTCICVLIQRCGPTTTFICLSTVSFLMCELLVCICLTLDSHVTRLWWSLTFSSVHYFPNVLIRAHHPQREAFLISLYSLT